MQYALWTLCVPFYINARKKFPAFLSSAGNLYKECSDVTLP